MLVLLALAPVGLSACGGDSDEPAVPTTVEEPTAVTVLTQAELISAGDGICAEINAAVGSIQASETSDDELKASQIADLYAGLGTRLEELGTPSDGEAPTAVIEAAQALGDPASTSESALADFQTAATEYGMPTCAEAPAAPLDTGGTVDPGAGGTVDPGTGGTVGPAPAPAPAPTPAPAPAPPAGGGVPPDSGGGTGGGSGSPGGSSGGISPG